MKARVISVTFEADVHQTKSRFQVPPEVVKILRVGKKGPIALAVREKSGRPLYGGTHLMASRFEVYGTEMDRSIKPRKTILVEASKP